MFVQNNRKQHEIRTLKQFEEKNVKGAVQLFESAVMWKGYKQITSYLL